MKRHRYLWILVGLLVFTSLACNAFVGEPLEPTLPRPDLPGGDSDGDGAGLPADLPTAVIQNIAPTATLAGEFPPTATPIVAEPVDGEPLLRALVDVNIRLGPGVAYARDSFVLKGETAVVLGRHAESGWWKIVCPERSDGNVCWVSGGSQYTSVNNAGAAQSVAAPPTAIPEPTVAATAVSDSSASSSVADLRETETVATDLVFGMASAGSRMVYVDEGALWLLSLDGETSEPTWLAEAENVSEVLISPNGRYVAYVIVNDTDASLHVVDIETGAVQTLIEAADLANMSLSDEFAILIGQMQWLDSSKAIAFNTYALNLDGPGVGSQEDLWTVDMAGNLIERFPAGMGGGSFTISADGVVLLGQTTAVIRVNLDGSNRETVIDFEFVNTASEFAFYPWLQWTESGSSATAAISSSEPYTFAEADLWRIPVAGDAESLTSLEGNIIFSPVIWSGSGRQLGYVLETGGADSALVIGLGDGTETSIYADKPLRFFGWSPAERHFVYAGQGNYAVGQVGGEPLVVEVAEGKTAVSAQWINDNTFIIALGSADNWDFRLQTIEGPATRLVSGSNTPLFDSWTP